MKHVINLWGDVLRTELELSDITVGQEYRANKYVSPKYLENSILVAEKVCKNSVKMTCPKYPEDKFYIWPNMLGPIAEVLDPCPQNQQKSNLSTLQSET